MGAGLELPGASKQGSGGLIVTLTLHGQGSNASRAGMRVPTEQLVSNETTACLDRLGDVAGHVGLVEFGMLVFVPLALLLGQ